MGEDQYENITVQQQLAPPTTDFLASLLSLSQVRLANICWRHTTHYRHLYLISPLVCDHCTAAVSPSLGSNKLHSLLSMHADSHFDQKRVREGKLKTFLIKI